MLEIESLITDKVEKTFVLAKCNLLVLACETIFDLNTNSIFSLDGNVTFSLKAIKWYIAKANISIGSSLQIFALFSSYTGIKGVKNHSPWHQMSLISVPMRKAFQRNYVDSLGIVFTLSSAQTCMCQWINFIRSYNIELRRGNSRLKPILCFNQVDICSNRRCSCEAYNVSLNEYQL